MDCGLKKKDRSEDQGEASQVGGSEKAGRKGSNEGETVKHLGRHKAGGYTVGTKKRIHPEQIKRRKKARLTGEGPLI